MPTIGSLFAGIGGFDLGFERAGFTTVWQVEIDKAAQGVLRRRFPAAQLHSDVREVGAHNLEPVDVLTFGSPCQDLSVAGKRAGLAGERSGLFHEAARVIRELRERHGKPDFVIWENVPGAFSSNDGRDFAAVVQTMVDLGARDVCWRVLDSRYFGVAQRRRRVFLVADFGGERAESVLFEFESLRGDSAKGGKARKGAAATAEAGAGDGRGWWDGGGIADTLDVSMLVKRQMLPEKRRFPCVLEPVPPAVGALCSDSHPGAYSGQDAYTGRLVPTAQPVAFHPTQDPISSQDGCSHAMSSGNRQGCATVAVCVRKSGPGYWLEDELSGPLRAEGENRPSRPSNVAVCATGEITHPLTASSNRGATEDGYGRGMPRVAHPANSIFQDSQYGVAEYDSAGSLRAGRIPEHQMIINPVQLQVRRLMPTECEALQGFPRDWTAEARLPDGALKQQADGPRYKQLGNAVTVNVAEWIAQRLRATLDCAAGG